MAKIESDLTQGNIRGHMLRIALPSMTGYIFNSLYNWIATFWGGKISTAALAALSATFPVFLISIAIGQCMFTGALIIISNALGAKDDARARHYAEQAVGLSVILGVVSAVVLAASARPILVLLGAEGNTLELSLQYITTVSWGIPFQVFAMTCVAALISRGDTKFQRNVFILNAFLNVWLTPLFMYGIRIGGVSIIPKMGMHGIALATVIVQVLGAALIFRKVVSQNFIRVDSIRRFFINFSSGARIVFYGLPTFLQVGLASFGMLIINFFLFRLGTSTAVAGYGIGIRVEQLILVTAIGIGMALSAIVGQNNGARQYHRIREALHTALMLAAIVLVCGMLPLALLGKYIAAIFTQEPAVINVTWHYLLFALAHFYGFLLLTLSSSTLQGMKHPVMPVILVVIRQLVLPWAFIPLFAYALGWGVYGVFASYSLSVWLTAIVILLVAVFTVRKKIRLQEDVLQNSRVPSDG